MVLTDIMFDGMMMQCVSKLIVLEYRYRSVEIYSLYNVYTLAIYDLIYSMYDTVVLEHFETDYIE